MIYLIVFFLSVLFTAAAERAITKRFLFCLFSFLALAPLVLLATFRDPGVGTDTLYYVQYTWDKIISIDSWEKFSSAYKKGFFDDIEWIYLAINYVASCFSKDVHSLYFFTSLITILPVYLAAIHYRKETPMWLIMCVYLLLYYTASFNLMRQAVALSFCIYSFKFLEQRKWVRLVIWAVIISFTHNTGIIFCGYILLWMLLQSDVSRLVKRLVAVSVIILLLLSTRYIDVILARIISLGVLPEKFLLYAAADSEKGLSRSSLLTYIAILLVFIYAYSFLKRRKDLDNKIVGEYCVMKLLGCLLFSASLVSTWLFRISYYFNYPVDCIMLPKALSLIRRKNKSTYRIIVFFLITFLTVSWYWLVSVVKMNEVYPYKSKILGI